MIPVRARHELAVDIAGAGNAGPYGRVLQEVSAGPGWQAYLGRARQAVAMQASHPY